MATSTKTNESIDAYYEGQRKPVEAEIENATAAYEAALAKLQQQKEAADADAYRSYVRQQHEMPGILRAQGNHGGMVDSAVASLLNKYNQGRADRGLQLGANTADQTLQYNANVNSLRAKLAQLEQQANAEKAELAAAQAAARGRSRRRKTTESEVSRYPGTMQEFAAEQFEKGGDYYPNYPRTENSFVRDRWNDPWNNKHYGLFRTKATSLPRPSSPTTTMKGYTPGYKTNF